MNKKISTTLIMLIMVLSTVGAISASIPVELNPCSMPIELDCSRWSTDDTTVKLGVGSWPLLDGTAVVSAYKTVECENCCCKDCIDCDYNCACDDDCNCCCACNLHNGVCLCDDSSCYMCKFPFNLVCGELSHRGTRGIGVVGQEDDEIDSINSFEGIIISFDEPQTLKFFEIRSLFIEKFNGVEVVEQGDATLFLGATFVQNFHFEGQEVIGSGYGSVIVPPKDSEINNLVFDKIVFYARSFRYLCKTVNHDYNIFSDFAVAKLETATSSTSFVQPLVGIDCDNEPENIPPVADAGGPYKGFVGQELTFNGSNSYDLDGTIVHYRWSYTTGENFPANIDDGVEVTYVFENPGIYNLELKVIDDDGAEDSNVTTVEIIQACEPDSDGDGIPDDVDNCPTIYNPDQADNDEDGIGDVCDDDDDNDGIPDDEDDDIDGDGYTNEDEEECGSDPNDADSVPDDNDGDFIPDCVDEDDDNDGYTDEDEVACGSDPKDPDSIPADNDGDFIPDCVDEDDDNDTVPDEVEDHNNDGDNSNDDNDDDGIPDYQDPDDDNDGIPTQDEDPNEDGDPTNDDTDGDGIPDYLDPEDNQNNNNNNNNNNGGNGGSPTYNPSSNKPKNVPPVADAGGPYFEIIDVEVTFDGSDSSDSDGDIISYKWDFGDGTTGTGKVVSHLYKEIRIYNVKLTVKDNSGLTDEDSTTADIRGTPNSVPTNPIMNGSTEGFVDVVINFTVSSFDEDDELISFIIDWGDGYFTITDFIPINEEFVVEHVWSSLGTYKIIVQADDGKTISSATKLEITIIDDESIINEEDGNIFWNIVMMMSIILFLGPASLILRRKMYE